MDIEDPKGNRPGTSKDLIIPELLLLQQRAPDNETPLDLSQNDQEFDGPRERAACKHQKCLFSADLLQSLVDDMAEKIARAKQEAVEDAKRSIGREMERTIGHLHEDLVHYMRLAESRPLIQSMIDKAVKLVKRDIKLKMEEKYSIINSKIEDQNRGTQDLKQMVE